MSGKNQLFKSGKTIRLQQKSGSDKKSHRIWKKCRILAGSGARAEIRYSPIFQRCIVLADHDMGNIGLESTTLLLTLHRLLFN